ncbi:MAG: hypothetical protein QOH88_986 [Verrucomicrobiota bacterium]|jgi:beta-lactam-binding protein with PASTA domain
MKSIPNAQRKQLAVNAFAKRNCICMIVLAAVTLTFKTEIGLALFPLPQALFIWFWTRRDSRKNVLRCPQKLKTCFVTFALLTVIAPVCSQGQADRVAEIQRSLDQAAAEEAATKAKWEKELKTFEQAKAEYEASLKTSKPLGRPIQVYEKKARADYDAATKKRAALEAELAKAKAASVTQAPSTPKPTPPPPAESDQARVPDLSAFDNVSEMKAALAHAGLTGAFSAAGKPPNKEKEFKFAAQSPVADTKVKRGSIVTVSIYQKFEGDGADEVVVPDLSVFDSVSEMKAVLAHAGLTGAFSAKGTPPSKEKEFKFAAQSPPANIKVKRGSTVSVSVYQKFEADSTEAVPDLIGKTLEQAGPLLAPVQLSIGGIDDTQKTDKPELVNTIFEQSPPAGAKLPASKLVTVRRYGGLAKKGASPTPSELEQLIPGADKDLIGQFEGQAQVTTFELSDYKHEHPQQTTKKVTVGIWRDDKGQWHFSGRVGDNAGIGETGGSGALTTVSGGVLTFEQHQKDVDRTCTVKVSGNQLFGTCQNTLKDGNLQPAPINFTATRTK